MDPIASPIVLNTEAEVDDEEITHFLLCSLLSLLIVIPNLHLVCSQWEDVECSGWKCCYLIDLLGQSWLNLAWLSQPVVSQTYAGDPGSSWLHCRGMRLQVLAWYATLISSFRKTGWSVFVAHPEAILSPCNEICLSLEQQRCSALFLQICTHPACLWGEE